MINETTEQRKQELVVFKRAWELIWSICGCDLTLAIISERMGRERK